MENMFHITVVIPAYNAASHIERAIRSVLAQTYPADEVIVVNDGSTDTTSEKVRQFGDRVTLIEQANAGVSAARNAGIHAASGEWIAFLDADDEWLPNYLAMQTALLNRCPDLRWSMTNYYAACPEENRQAAYILCPKTRNLNSDPDIQEDYLQSYLSDTRGHLNTTIVHKEVFPKTGLFDTTLPAGEDLDLWFRMSYLYPRFGFLFEPLAVYYVSTSRSLTKQNYPVDFFMRFIHRHLDLSARYSRRKAFEPVAAKMIRLWIRGMFFDAQGDDIRLLVHEFSGLFSLWYKMWIILMTLSPAFTAKSCRLISKVVRALRLRRRVVPPPVERQE